MNAIDAAMEVGSRAENRVRRGLWFDAWRRLRRHRLAMAGAGLLAFIVLFCFAGPFLSPYRFDAQNLAYGARGPSLRHWFGTDAHGRDLLVRVMMGGRISLEVGWVATLVSVIIGSLWGAAAGFAGGRVDGLMMRVVDVLYVLPFMFLVIILLVLFGQHFILLFVALGAVSWLTMSRIVRGQVLSLREREFVEAARALGASRTHILLRHLLPNTLGPVIVYATLTVPSVMLDEAFLSYLGLGVQPPLASWGSLVSDGADSMLLYPHLLICPALFLAATLFALNFLGDGLRDALDPRMR